MVMVNPERLSGVIGGIYDATYDATRWTAAIDDLRNLVHGSQACFCRFGPDFDPRDVVASNADPAFQQRYIDEHAGSPDPFAAALSIAPVGKVHNGQVIVENGTFKRSRLWNDWMKPQDMYGGLSSKLLVSGPSFWFIDVQRGRKQDAFEPGDIALLELVVPHLARAAEIQRQFQADRLLASAFSHLPFGMVLVDGHMRIVTSNAAADAILLRPGSGLVRKSDSLGAVDAGSMAALRRLIAQACSRRDGIIPGTGGDLLIRTMRQGVGVDLALSIGPLVNPTPELPFLGRHAVIFIREITLDLPAGFHKQLRVFFDLTPREAGLAAALASGLTLKEAAENARIQISTARSYLDNIFLKTGTRQQSQLVALLRSPLTITRPAGN